MFTKLKNKMSSMTGQNGLSVGLGIFTLVMLLVFVILAATLDKDITQTVNHPAKTGVTDVGPDHTGLAVHATFGHNTVTNVINADKGIYTVDVAAYSVKETIAFASYANALAASGTVFVISLFAALITTVIFAKKKGGE